MICPYSVTSTAVGKSCGKWCAKFDQELEQCYDVTVAQAFVKVAECVVRLFTPIHVFTSQDTNQVDLKDDPEVVETDDKP